MSLTNQKNKYRESEGEESNQEDWLISYADLVTLLMGFFVIMLSVSTIDPSKFEKLNSDINEDKVKTPLNEIKATLDSLLSTERAQKQVRIDIGSKGIVMYFASSAFYSAGSAEISPTAAKIIDKVTLAVKTINYYPFSIDLEGHTDDVPIKTIRYPSNWELSVSRATNIVKHMVQSGVDANRLKAAGYADTKPVEPNRDANGKSIPENQALNRRIVIRIY